MSEVQQYCRDVLRAFEAVTKAQDALEHVGPLSSEVMKEVYQHVDGRELDFHHVEAFLATEGSREVIESLRSKLDDLRDIVEHVFPETTRQVMSEDS